jgi:hypothetical protein
VDRNPFEVLNLRPDAGLDAARSSYRALARSHHPDTAPAAGRARATKIMAELNWAMEELERDLEGWRRLLSAGASADAFFDAWLDLQPQDDRVELTVEPRLVILNADNGFEAWVTAAARGVSARELKLRYASSLISVGRMDTPSGVTNFRIRLAPGVAALDQEQSETVEVRAPRGEPVRVRIAVAPFTAEDAALARQGRGTSYTHWWETLAAGAAVMGALAIVLLVA